MAMPAFDTRHGYNMMWRFGGNAMRLTYDDGRDEILETLSNQSWLLARSLLAGNSLGIKNMFYFGDSLSDSHRDLEEGGTTLWNELGYAGRATNGLVHAQIVPYLLGIATEKSHNYAVAGGTALGDAPTHDGLGSSLTAQLNDFLADGYDRAMLSDSAATIYIGLNDFANALATNVIGGADNLREVLEKLADDVLAKVEADSRKLIDAGMGTIILNGIQTGEAVSLIKMVNDLLDGATQLADDVLGLLGINLNLNDYFGGDDFLRTYGEELLTRYNQGLRELSDTLAQETGAKTRFVDMDSLFDAVQADGDAFGFSNTAVSWYTLPQIGGYVDGWLEVLARNPLSAFESLDGMMWIDPIHPTAKMHQIMAAYQATTLEADRTAFLGNGNDYLNSLAGDDLIFANKGNDRIYANGGNDVVFGGKGRDLVVGGSGNDILAGGSDNDTLRGGSNDDVLLGHDGNDVLYGDVGNDLLHGGEGVDHLYGGYGNDTFIFENAEYVPKWWEFWRDKSHETIHGGHGQDTLYLLFESDRLRTKLEQDLRDGPNSKGAIVFDDIRLTVYGVERIIIMDGEADEIYLGNTELQANADMAELWSIL